MSIERIVRPFQTTDVFSARVQPPVQPPLAVTDDDPVLSWAGGVSTDYVEEPQPASMGITVEWKEDSSRRVTETIRVENKDDASQFVDIERIKSTVFKNTTTGEEMPLKLDWK